MNQTEKILEFMDKVGDITQRDAYEMGIYRLASRINDLRKAGVEIESTMKTVVCRDGSTARIAVYRRAK